jgi:hypothetical protein
MYINFDNKTVETGTGEQRITLSFAEAIQQGIVTQEQLDKDEQRFLEMALIDIEDAGLVDVTETANKQNGTHHWYVFANAKGTHYCDTVEDVFDLAETL